MTMNATCSDVTGLLNDYVDDALPSELRQGIGVHLDACAECAAALRHLRCTRRLLRRLPREPMPDPMKNKLLDALRSTRPNRSPQKPPGTRPDSPASDS